MKTFTRCLAVVLFLSTIGMGADKASDKLSDEFREAAIVAVNAIGRSVVGDQRENQSASDKAMDVADSKQKNAADSQVFGYLKDFAITTEMARLEISTHRLNMSTKGEQGSSMPDSKNVKLFTACREQLNKAVRAGIVPSEYSCASKAN